MSGRETILRRLRASLRAGDDAARRRAVSERLARHPVNPVPARGAKRGRARIKLFCDMAGAVQTTITRIEKKRDIPGAVAAYLRGHNIQPRLRHGEDRLFADLAWDRQAPAIEVLRGPAQADDEVGLSHAFAGVAETGTLVLLSGADNPTTLNFLPETHIVVLAEADVVGAYEDVWRRLRERFGETVMPRTVNLITGPSRTADIEQKLELGAHGPRRVHVILVGPA